MNLSMRWVMLIYASVDKQIQAIYSEECKSKYVRGEPFGLAQESLIEGLRANG